MDVSFSGMLTKIKELAATKLESGECTKSDLCYSLQGIVLLCIFVASNMWDFLSMTNH
jgi:tRNA A37 threonylcarbamoyltransferase TsaD